MSFKKLSEKWFYAEGTKSPEQAVRALNKWIKDYSYFDPKSKEAQKKYATFVQQLVTDYDKSVFSYWTGDWDRLSAPRIKRLDWLVVSLRNEGAINIHRPGDQRVIDNKHLNKRYKPDPISTLSRKSIALLCDLDVSKLPSPHYQLDIIYKCVESMKNYDLSVHNVSQTTINIELRRVAQMFQPSAIIMLRLTPSLNDIKVLDVLKKPVILVHANKSDQYHLPVLANIFPEHHKSNICKSIKQWAEKDLEQLKNAGHSNQIVFATMPPEKEDGSIRNERIKIIYEGLKKIKDVKIEKCEVRDYDFWAAQEIWNSYPQAIGYVVLSDQIAFALNMLITTSTSKRTYPAAIFRYDNSYLAGKGGFSSFSQGLELIGKNINNLLDVYFKKQDIWMNKKPAEKIKLPVKISIR